MLDDGIAHCAQVHYALRWRKVDGLVQSKELRLALLAFADPNL